MKPDHPTLILIRGLPGSGKSYFARALLRQLDPQMSIGLDPDETDYTSDEYKEHVRQQFEQGVDEKLHPYRFLRAKAYTAIEAHKTIVWNQPFTNLETMKKVTDRLQEQAAVYGTTLPILVVEVDADVDVAKERVQNRKRDGGHGPSDGTFERFAREYSTCRPLGYDVISIDGQTDVDHSVQSVLTELDARSYR